MIKPVINYCAPVWFPNASGTAIRALQTVQNAALRIATGSLLMASEDHLHQEACMLKVGDSLGLLCAQFLASSLRPGHPSHNTVTSASGQRQIRSTLQSSFSPIVSHLLNTEGVLPPEEYRGALKSLHTSAVETAIAALTPNRILLEPPPPIDPGEKSLLRPSPYHSVTAPIGLLVGLGGLPRQGRYCRQLHMHGVWSPAPNSWASLPTAQPTPRNYPLWTCGTGPEQSSVSWTPTHPLATSPRPHPPLPSPLPSTARSPPLFFPSSPFPSYPPPLPFPPPPLLGRVASDKQTR